MIAIRFKGGPLDGKVRTPAPVIVEFGRQEYYYRTNSILSPLHEYRVDWREGTAEYVGEVE